VLSEKSTPLFETSTLTVSDASLDREGGVTQTTLVEFTYDAATTVVPNLQLIELELTKLVPTTATESPPFFNPPSGTTLNTDSK